MCDDRFQRKEYRIRISKERMRAHPQDAITPRATLQNANFPINVPPTALILLPRNEKHHSLKFIALGRLARETLCVIHTFRVSAFQATFEVNSTIIHERTNLLSLVGMMSNNVYDSARWIQWPVQCQRDAGVTWNNGLRTSQVFVPLIFADASTSLQIRSRCRGGTTTATHHRARYRFPLKRSLQLMSRLCA